jgi:hypothetical protein
MFNFAFLLINFKVYLILNLKTSRILKCFPCGSGVIYKLSMIKMLEHI